MSTTSFVFTLRPKRDDLISLGLSPDEAMEEAARQFGDRNQTQQICVRIEQGRVRRMHFRESLSGWRQDFQYAFRQLRHNPGFTATAILTLALGIGVNTSIFTLSDQILLRLLPVERPRELVQLRVDGGRAGAQSGDGVHTFSYPAFLMLRDSNKVFAALTGQALESAGLSVNGRNQYLNVAMVAGNYFDTFGVKAYAGRMLELQDDRVRMGAPVAVLRYEFWQSQMGADPAVVGSKISLNGYPFSVIGIAAPGFEGTDMAYPSNIWIPATMKPALTPADNSVEDERFAWFYLFARLKPGVSIRQAEAAMKVLYHQRQEDELKSAYFQETPQERERFLKQTFKLEPAQRGQSSLRDRFERPLIVLQWLVGAVLLIACTNIAGLLLARCAARQREMAIRGAMGAGRGRLIRQLLIESLVFACIGGTAGILISGWATRVLLRLIAADPADLALHPNPDVRVLAFAAALTIIAVMIFGLLPAWQGSRPVAEALKESAGTITGSLSQARLRKAFVSFQLALSILLLIGAGLFTRTLRNLRAIDLGFQTEGVVTFTAAPVTRYDDAHKLQVFRLLMEALAGTPGVKAAGANTTPLLSGYRWDGAMRIAGAEPASGDASNSFFNAITPGYFQALGIPIKEGRDLSWKDWGKPNKYCLVNEALVHDYLAGRNPVGMKIGQGRRGPVDFEIVGVFANARYHDPRGRIPRQTFFSLDSRIHGADEINVYARVQGDPRAMMPQLREQVRRVDSNLLIDGMRTLDGQLNLRLKNERLLALLSDSFAFLAVLLAATGLYGVLSFLVLRRKREIGIRLALGARRGQVIGLLLHEMAPVIGAGVLAGLAAAILCGRFVQSELYGVKSFDAAVFLASVVLLAACSLFASALPAWRASRVDVTTTLRQQ